MSSIHQILLELGPYEEHEILADFTAAEWSRRNLTLSNVKMETLDGDPTGLDETEVVDPASDNTSEHDRSFNFAGIFKVEKLEWLSLRGQKRIEADYLRETRKHFRLESYFDSHGVTLSIWILCRCSGKVGNTFEKDSETLLLRSDRDHLRDVPRNSMFFKITSMHVTTMSKSNRFLEQWRLYRFVRDTCKESHIPREQVTVDWLVDKYQEAMRSPPSAAATHAAQATHPRYVSKAEIRNIFLKHAEFLLAQQLVTSDPRHRFMNLGSLLKFTNDAPKERRQLAIARGETAIREGSLLERLCQPRIGGKVAVWKSRIETIERNQGKPMAPKPKVVKPSNREPRASHVVAAPGYESSASSETEDDGDGDGNTAADIERAHANLELPALGPGTWDIFTYLMEHATPDTIRGLRSRICMDLSIAEWPCPLCGFRIDMRRIKAQCAKQLANTDPDGRKTLVSIARRFFRQAWAHRADHWREYGITSEVVHGENKGLHTSSASSPFLVGGW